MNLEFGGPPPKKINKSSPQDYQSIGRLALPCGLLSYFWNPALSLSLSGANTDTHFSRVGKVGSVVRTRSTEFILVFLLINYCPIFRMSNCKPTLVSPRVPSQKPGGGFAQSVWSPTRTEWFVGRQWTLHALVDIFVTLQTMRWCGIVPGLALRRSEASLGGQAGRRGWAND